MEQQLEIPPTRWQKEGRSAGARVFLGIWGGLIVAILGLVILTIYFSTPKEAVKKVETYAMPSFEGAKTIFVVTDKPSEKLLSDLETAYQNGSKVQLITTESVSASYNITVVSPHRIIRNAILINGAAWYPMPP